MNINNFNLDNLKDRNTNKLTTCVNYEYSNFKITIKVKTRGLINQCPKSAYNYSTPNYGQTSRPYGGLFALLNNIVEYVQPKAR